MISLSVWDWRKEKVERSWISIWWSLDQPHSRVWGHARNKGGWGSDRWQERYIIYTVALRNAKFLNLPSLSMPTDNFQCKGSYSSLWDRNARLFVERLWISMRWGRQADSMVVLGKERNWPFGLLSHLILLSQKAFPASRTELMTLTIPIASAQIP